MDRIGFRSLIKSVISAFNQPVQPASGSPDTTDAKTTKQKPIVIAIGLVLDYVKQHALDPINVKFIKPIQIRWDHANKKLDEIFPSSLKSRIMVPMRNLLPKDALSNQKWQDLEVEAQTRRGALIEKNPLDAIDTTKQIDPLARLRNDDALPKAGFTPAKIERGGYCMGGTLEMSHLALELMQNPRQANSFEEGLQRIVSDRSKGATKEAVVNQIFYQEVYRHVDTTFGLERNLQMEFLKEFIGQATTDEEKNARAALGMRFSLGCNNILGALADPPLKMNWLVKDQQYVSGTLQQAYEKAIQILVSPNPNSKKSTSEQVLDALQELNIPENEQSEVLDFLDYAKNFLPDRVRGKIVEPKKGSKKSHVQNRIKLFGMNSQAKVAFKRRIDLIHNRQFEKILRNHVSSMIDRKTIAPILAYRGMALGKTFGIAGELKDTEYLAKVDMKNIDDGVYALSMSFKTGGHVAQIVKKDGEIYYIDTNIGMIKLDQNNPGDDLAKIIKEYYETSDNNALYLYELTRAPKPS